MYIGFAKSFEERWKKHKWKLKRNIHENNHLQSAWNIDGESNFKFERIEICDREKLAAREHYWCMLLKVHDRAIGYNKQLTDPNGKCGPSPEMIAKAIATKKTRVYPKVTKTVSAEARKKIGDKNRGKRHTPETLEKLSKAAKGRKHTPEMIEWLRQHSTGKKHSDETKKRLSEMKMGMKYSEEHNRNVGIALTNNPKISIPVVQMTTNGEYVKEYPSVMEVSRVTGISSGQLSDVIYGKKQSAGGYMFCYKKDYIPGKYKRVPNKVDPRAVMQYTLSGEFVKEWSMLSEAAEFLWGNRRRGSELSSCCRGERKQAAGYKWKYKEETTWNTKK